jgi:hypothetical protein
LGFLKVDKVGLNAYSKHEILNGGVLNMRVKNRLLVAYITLCGMQHYSLVA